MSAHRLSSRTASVGVMASRNTRGVAAYAPATMAYLRALVLSDTYVGSGYAEESLEAVTPIQSSYQFCNCFWLITRRREGRLKVKYCLGHSLYHSTDARDARLPSRL